MMCKQSPALDHFKGSNMDQKARGLKSTVLDMQEGLVDDSVFQKVLRN